MSFKRQLLTKPEIRLLNKQKCELLIALSYEGMSLDERDTLEYALDNIELDLKEHYETLSKLKELPKIVDLENYFLDKLANERHSK